MRSVRKILRRLAAVLGFQVGAGRLSRRRYHRLSPTDKADLALKRYLQRWKSKWEIGREYERYVGYLYEMNGWTVQFCGATEGLNDRGRDLIAFRNGVTHLVQCKLWSRRVEIPEDVVYRFLGSVTQYAVSRDVLAPGADILQTLDRERITGVLVTTTQLSAAARRACAVLGVRYRVNKALEEYPRIKCNIDASGARIFHLPNDRFYDHVRIEPQKGEFYAWTAHEAAKQGFRRARRPPPGRVLHLRDA